jgi:lipopolysaccharide export system ATP-binding protein
MTFDPVLQVDGLGKTFGRKAVLTAASFSARPGTVTCLMGRNGSGKTTMLNVAVGRVRADYGRVLLNGELQRRPRLAMMALGGLFYSSQDSALTNLFTIQQHLDAVSQVYGRVSEQASIVEHLDLGPFLTRRPPTLSGGERQRASIALALVRGPSCLLMDEPFAGVAPKDRPLIADGLRLLRADGCAVVISGHDVDDLFAVSDEIVWVVAGTTHLLGPPSDARTYAQFRREYLGPQG